MRKLMLFLALWPFTASFSCALVMAQPEAKAKPSPMFHNFQYSEYDSLVKGDVIAVGSVTLNMYIDIKNIQLIRRGSEIDIKIPQYKKPNGPKVPIIEFLDEETEEAFRNYILNVYNACQHEPRKPFLVTTNTERYIATRRFRPERTFRKEFLNLTKVERNDRAKLSQDISLTFDNAVKINGFKKVKTDEGGSRLDYPTDANTGAYAVSLISAYGLYNRLGPIGGLAVRSHVAFRVIMELDR